MQIKVVEVGYLQTNCYFVIDENTMDTAVIDPGDDSNRILNAIEQGGFHVKAILLTHGHFDHCMGLGEVYEATRAPVYMSHKDLEAGVGSASFGLDWELDPPEDDTRFVSEGDEIVCGDMVFTVLETPGHTPGSVCLLCSSADGDRALFSGDTLFRDSCGRTDFRGGSTEDMMRSLARLAAIPGDCEVYPGHGFPTSLARERAVNYFMRAALQQ